MTSELSAFVFHGHFRHSVDSKGRVAIPKRFRKNLPPESNGRLVLNLGHDSTIEIHPLSEWERFEVATLASLDKHNPLDRKKLRAMLSLFSEVELDSASRVLVPKYLLDYAHLAPGSECVFRGMGRYIELVAASAFDKLIQEYLESYDAITDVKKPEGANAAAAESSGDAK